MNFIHEPATEEPNGDLSETLEALDFDSHESECSDDSNYDEIPHASHPVRELPLLRQLAYARRFKKDGHLILKIQFLNESSFFVHAHPSMLISHFKLKYFRKEIRQNNKKVRLIHRGHELYDKKKVQSNDRAEMMRLSDYPLEDESVLHCLITEKNTSQQNAASSTGNQHNVTPDSIQFHDALIGDLDFGNRLLLPLFCLLLSSSWLLRIAYRQYFSVLSTLALVGLTVIFAIFSFAIGLLRYQNHDSTIVVAASRSEQRDNPDESVLATDETPTQQ
ncbi:transmembrane and ubiquitin-like domain containing 2 [Cichlidogyrus casuarinus]|uniref:Transmembrane and ubiquitin-like domain containing 2 n=1 Tax=Cichlidogyrus casuarinus TaxID=1844966 RepID=A0ABD2Q8N3_9PLAT